jgi:D-sedoheptulose 7-phosphate isomerase
MTDSVQTKFFSDSLAASIAAKHCVNLEAVARVAEQVFQCLKSGHKVLLAGNGGSAADAQHIAAEFTGRFLKDRHPLPAIALTTDTSAITAIGNDYGFEAVFSRQIQALGQPGDVFFAISTSGNSPNLLAAIEAAQTAGVSTVGVTGKDGGAIRTMVDHSIHVPHPDTPRIQETHIMALHMICEWVDYRLGVA